MRFFIILASAIFLSCANVSAADKPISKGDVIELVDGKSWSAHTLRKKLREIGFRGLGPGGQRGHIIGITGYYGDDSDRYDIRVNAKTGLVLRVALIRNFTY